MIADKLEHKNRYGRLGSNFEKAFRFLAENRLEEMPVGRYEICGDEVYAMVQSYVTRPAGENRWEAHRKYIDIQYVVEGKEMIGWTPTELLKVSQSYMEEKDIAFFEETEEWSPLYFSEGYFSILFPEDAHKPCCIHGEASSVKKVVIKIRVEEEV